MIYPKPYLIYLRGTITVLRVGVETPSKFLVLGMAVSGFGSSSTGAISLSNSQHS